jgi:hypothetical protein
MQGDEAGLGLPAVHDFIRVCHASMARHTHFLLAFEARSSTVRHSLLEALRKAFATVKQIQLSSWRDVLDCTHVEMFLMRGALEQPQL